MYYFLLQCLYSSTSNPQALTENNLLYNFAMTSHATRSGQVSNKAIQNKSINKLQVQYYYPVLLRLFGGQL